MQQSRKFQVEVFIFEDFTCNPFVQNTLGAHVWVPRKQLSWSEDFAGSPPQKKFTEIARRIAKHARLKIRSSRSRGILLDLLQKAGELQSNGNQIAPAIRWN